MGRRNRITGRAGLRAVAALAAIVLILLVQSGCTSQNRDEGYAYFRLKNDPSTLDPALIVSVDAGLIAAKLFNGLVKLDENLEVAPDIASSWEVSPNALRYRFHLRQDIAFSSGRKVRAQDFKYSFERVLDPVTRSPNTWIFDNVLGAAEFAAGQSRDVRGITVIDGHTLDIRLTKPFSPFLSLLTMTTAYVVPMEVVLLKGEDFSSGPVGTGPYVLETWLPGRHVRLARNTSYFGDVPGVKGMVFRVIPEELTAVAEFEIGNLDVLDIPNSEYSRYMKSGKWRPLISQREGINTYYLGLNCSRKPFDDAEVRRAMNMAIDRAKILATLFEGRGRLASGPVPDLLRRWPAPPLYAYDPAKAREIIERKGLKGASVSFFLPADPQVVDVAEVAQAYYKAVGLNVKLTQLEWSAFKSAINSGEADMFWLSWWADYSDPENFLFPLFHSSNLGPAGNRVFYINREADELIEQGQHAPGIELRNTHYEQAENIIASDAPWVFFWHRTDYTVRQDWVGDFRIYPVYSMDKGTEISLKKIPQ